MKPEELLHLLDKYANDELTEGERSQLFHAITSGQFDALIQQHISQRLSKGDLAPAEMAPHRSADILHRILSSEKQNQELLPDSGRKVHLWRWIAAAACIILIVSAMFWILQPKPPIPGMPSSLALQTKIIENSTKEIRKLQLEDGSVVVLEPGASIHFPEHFASDRREVYLNGDAFFEITKNPRRPFYVYNKQIVTHVLGTSFYVTTNPKTGQAEVSVKTGRVEVYENASAEQSDNKKNVGVILLPNQKANFNPDSREFVATLVDLPLIVQHPSSETETVQVAANFNETPLRAIVPLLQKNFGIEILVENDDIYNCLFTGDIDQQDLYSRLNILCEAIGATYEVKGTRILIRGRGCN